MFHAQNAVQERGTGGLSRSVSANVKISVYKDLINPDAVLVSNIFSSNVLVLRTATNDATNNTHENEQTPFVCAIQLL